MMPKSETNIHILYTLYTDNNIDLEMLRGSSITRDSDVIYESSVAGTRYNNPCDPLCVEGQHQYPGSGGRTYIDCAEGGLQRT